MQTAALPIWPDAPSVEGEEGVRVLHGRLHVFDLDARNAGRAARLLDAAPAPSGLTDGQLTAAIYACRGPEGRGHDAFHNALLEEREHRRAGLRAAA